MRRNISRDQRSGTTAHVFHATLVVCALFLFASTVFAGDKDQKKSKNPQSTETMQSGKPMDASLRAAHVLNRFTYGARTGDIEKVAAMGVDKWFELQLNPEKIDDTSLQARIAPLKTLSMNTKEMIEKF